MFWGILAMSGEFARRRASLIVLAAAFACCNHAAAKDDFPTLNASRLFGSVEYASGDLQGFRKWQRMLASSAEELKLCRGGSCDERWRGIVDDARGYTLMGQLQKINRYINSKPYVPDTSNWGSSDYWATPLEFLRKGGDCEDYAIAKYMVLRHLGASTRDMRIVVLRDLNTSAEHAVLAVYIDGIPYILDSRTEAIRSSTSIANYQPIYSINEHGWWLHRDTRLAGRARERVMPARQDDERTITAARGTQESHSGDARPSRKAVVQLASFSRSIDAYKAVLEYRKRYHGVIRADDLAVSRAKIDGRGVWYRVLIGPFGARDTAIDLCGRLRSTYVSCDCFVTAVPAADWEPRSE
jgi:predicted transglutaminase-like cysteine proteinase